MNTDVPSSVCIAHAEVSSAFPSLKSHFTVYMSLFDNTCHNCCAESCVEAVPVECRHEEISLWFIKVLVS